MSSLLSQPSKIDLLDQVMERTGGLKTLNDEASTDPTINQTTFCRDPRHEAPADDLLGLSTRSDSSACPPVAIIGTALRLPGGISSPEEFWKFMIEKKNGLCEVPETRYKLDSFYSENKPNTVKTRRGYFLQDDPARFDAEFFSITPYEAARMDPQQRQLLEVVWECLENAGETNWRGEEIGCFVGVYGEDWLELASKDPQGLDRYHILGTGQFALSNRISYEYDFQGPSMTIQTGCSSSLVGLHEACQALYSGECSSAIVAGTNLVLAPTMTTTMSDNMVLSPSGMCRTFDEKADGYGRGEAINAIYIKRLSDAVRDKDPVRSVIRATSTNCDGKTPSITTPGSQSQERLIRRAYEKAQIKDISQTGFFECHGTGTTVGDTSETSVVANLFKEKGTVIGAVKPNVGHSEGASGITSVIKALLALEHKVIPPNVFFEAPNPNIPFNDAKLHVPVDAMPWPQGRKERVSVNCFGIGGANAHAVLESMPGKYRRDLNGETSHGESSDSSHLLVVSARKSDALQQRIEGIARYTNDHPDVLQDLSYTLGERREHLQHRAFAVVQPGKPIDASAFQTGQAKSSGLTFVLNGQGAQWPGMGKDLMDTFEDFRADIRAMNTALQELDDPPPWSLEDELAKVGSDSHVNEAEYSQPLSAALQIGLVNLLRRWGIHPSSVVGHSSGETTGAYAAGAITAKSALMLSYYRGKITKSQEGKGAMAAVGLGRDEVTPYMEEGAVLACENSPSSVTISGDRDVIGRITKRIKEDFPEVLCRALKIKTAYHSHHMVEPGAIFESRVRNLIEHNEEMVPFHSTVTRTTITKPQDLNSAYWRQNLESPVLFVDAVKSVLESADSGHGFLEIGPHSALAGPLRQIFRSAASKADPTYIPTIIRHADDPRSQLLYTIGCAYANGADVKLEIVNGPGKTLTDLPAYPWQHGIRYWHESRLAVEWRQRQSGPHEILGVRIAESSDLEPSWRNIFRLENVPWVGEHVLQGHVVFPAAGYIAMAGEAIRQLTPDVEDYSVRQLVLKSPLVIQEEQSVEMLTTLRPVKYTDLADSEWYAFSIMANDGTGWTKHCQGQVRSRFEHPPAEKEIKHNLRPVNSDQWYQALEKLGLNFGRQFRGLNDIFASPMAYEADAAVDDVTDFCSSRYTLHPTVIDQCMQLMSVASTNGLSRRIDQLAIPAAIGHIYIRSHASQMKLGAQLVQSDNGNLLGNATLMGNGVTLLSLNQVVFFSVQDQSLDDTGIPLTAEMRWTPDPDLVSPASWLPPAIQSETRTKIANDAWKMTILFIMEIADRMVTCAPVEPHMVNYKSWVTKEASQLRAEGHRTFPECRQWAQMCSEDRQKVIRHILSQHEGENSDDEHREVSVTFHCAQRVLQNCCEFAAGNRPPIDALMEEDSLEKFYDSSNKLASWKQLLQLLGQGCPSLRVLEIGGGTGSRTTDILQDLQTPEGVCLYSTYVFTDISPGFTLAAQEKFSASQNVEFKVLDISRDPRAQGFEPHAFDLVIAANALHATACLQETLRNVRELLSPNGKLLFLEPNPGIPTVDLVMGVLPGWWIGKDDQRAERPYVSPERWDRELRAAGFTGSEGWTYDTEPPLHLSFSMMSGLPQEPSSNKGILLVSSPDSPSWACEVESSFRENGYDVDWSSVDDEPPVDRDIIVLLDTNEPYLYQIKDSDFESLRNYLLKVKTKVLWVTKSSQLSCTDPRYGLIYGLARTLRHEVEMDISIFETEQFDGKAAESLQKVYEKIQRSRETQHHEPEYEFSFHEGVVHVGRCHWGPPSSMEPPETVNKSGKKLDISQYAMLDSLQWVDVPDDALGDDQVEVDIRYVGLNFRDIMVAMGLVGDKTQLGVEGSGIIRRVGGNVTSISPGDRVIAVNAGLLRTSIVTTPNKCWVLPDSLSLEEAAAVPVVYATAMYSLMDLGGLRKGQTVLVHSACGGVGIASIEICRQVGAEVFATVGSEEKVQFLMDQFGIPRNRIFNSRTAAFLPDILRETNGRGVDVVLNSLAGQLLHASWDCVANFGKMIELGKRDLLTNGTLNMMPFAGNRTFSGVDLLQLSKECPERFDDLFRRFIELCEEGKINLIRPLTKFSATKITDAFRYMQQGVHMGKILAEMPQDPAELARTKSETSVSFSPHASYLLVGGLGGIGRAISTWMVENGARHLVYLSRSAGRSEGDKSFLEELQAQGCSAVCVQGSVAELADVETAVAKCPKPIAGVLQLSMSLMDRTLGNMTHDQWTSALAPKVTGTWNLHKAVPNEMLDFFVIFSSIGGVCGNSGQANYAAANSFVDSFTRYRRQLNLPCSSIALGAVETVGFVSRTPSILQQVQNSYVRLITEGEVMKGVQTAIKRSRVALPTDADISNPIIVGMGNTEISSDRYVRTAWTRDIRYALYRNIESKGDNQESAKSDHLKALLAKVEKNPAILDEPETELRVRRELGEMITQHMSTSDEMDDDQTARIHIDSLMSIEIRSWARRNMGLEIGLADMSKASTVGELSIILVENLKIKYGGDQKS